MILLVLLSLLSLPVIVLLVSDGPHLLGIAVLDVECVLALEEDVPGEVLGHPALVLLLKVDEGLLSAVDQVHAIHFSLASGREVDL